MRLCLVLAAMLLSLPALAESAPDQSLFFTPGEMDNIDKPEAVQPAPLTVSSIHLGAVLYFGPGNWTVWLDGARWTPATQRDDLRIVDVEPNMVRISWKPNASAEPRIVVLRPHQTYQTVSGKVVEGQP